MCNLAGVFIMTTHNNHGALLLWCGAHHRRFPVTQGLLDSLARGPIVSLGFTSKRALGAVPHHI
jgi:hypothetical protein